VFVGIGTSDVDRVGHDVRATGRTHDARLFDEIDSRKYSSERFDSVEPVPCAPPTSDVYARLRSEKRIRTLRAELFGRVLPARLYVYVTYRRATC